MMIEVRVHRRPMLRPPRPGPAAPEGVKGEFHKFGFLSHHGRHAGRLCAQLVAVAAPWLKRRYHRSVKVFLYAAGRRRRNARSSAFATDAARFAPVALRHDESGLSAGDRQALARLVEAARVLNFALTWTSSGAATAPFTSACARIRRRSAKPAWITSGSIRVPGPTWTTIPPSFPACLNISRPAPIFYPEDMTQRRIRRLGEDAAARRPGRRPKDFSRVIRRDAGRHLTAVPYSQAYAADLHRAAALLRQAAALTA